MNPRDLVSATERSPVLPAGGDERSAVYGVVGLPFSSGHYLALRRIPASSLGTPHSTVWWRDPTGAWVMLTDVAPTGSCPRYFGRALERTETREIDISWSGPWSLRVTIPGLLEWDVELGSTRATRIMTALGGAAPRSMWRNRRQN